MTHTDVQTKMTHTDVHTHMYSRRIVAIEIVYSDLYFCEALQ